MKNMKHTSGITESRAVGMRCLFLLAILFASIFPAMAQNVVTLPKLVLEPKHTEYVSTQNANTPRIINVKSSNESVAIASVYRVSQVQIIAVGTGRADVEFFDAAQRILYRVPVWVEASNATGGGGAGYDRTRTQLPQIVMLVHHTENVSVPGDGRHQLSSVTSNKPAIATARTNTTNTIQIYSVTLGDTFINFADNATGMNYQVHVWVVKNLSDPIGGNGDSPSPTAKSNAPPKPKPNSNPKPKPGGVVGNKQAASSGSIDPCLVGTWEATQVVPSDKRYTGGGDGFYVTFDKDGTETVDYSAMRPFQISNDETTYSGSASARISTANKKAKVETILRQGVTIVPSKLIPGPKFQIHDLGFGGLGGTSGDNSYTCTNDSLEYQGSMLARDKQPDVSVTLTRKKN